MQHVINARTAVDKVRGFSERDTQTRATVCMVFVFPKYTILRYMIG